MHLRGYSYNSGDEEIKEMNEDMKFTTAGEMMSNVVRFEDISFEDIQVARINRMLEELGHEDLTNWWYHPNIALGDKPAFCNIDQVEEYVSLLHEYYVGNME